MIKQNRTFLLFLTFLLVAACKRTEYTTGQQAFQKECMKCHKLNSRGGTKGPELTDIFQTKDEEYVREYTLDPRSIKPDGTMPPSEITDREMDLLIAYLKEAGRPGTNRGANPSLPANSAD